MNNSLFQQYEGTTTNNNITNSNTASNTTNSITASNTISNITPSTSIRSHPINRMQSGGTIASNKLALEGIDITMDELLALQFEAYEDEEV